MFEHLKKITHLNINFPKALDWFYVVLVITPLLCYLAIFGIKNLVLLLPYYSVLFDYRNFLSHFVFIPTLTVEPLSLVLFLCFCSSLALLHFILLQFKCWFVFAFTVGKHSFSIVQTMTGLDSQSGFQLFKCTWLHPLPSLFCLICLSPSIYDHFITIILLPVSTSSLRKPMAMCCQKSQWWIEREQDGKLLLSLSEIDYSFLEICFVFLEFCLRFTWPRLIFHDTKFILS